MSVSVISLVPHHNSKGTKTKTEKDDTAQLQPQILLKHRARHESQSHSHPSLYITNTDQ